jgi:ESS family glutamate:Na+ symporter
MTINPFLILALAIPVLLLGEQILRLIPPLARLNIPTPVVGGFFIAALVLLTKSTALPDLTMLAKTTAPWWNFWVATEWQTHEETLVILPLLVLFYTTLGLSASWDMVRRGGLFLTLYLVSTVLISILQNAVGIATAWSMGAHPLLGMMCGSVSLMGGPSTSIGFTRDFEEAGFKEAGPTGIAVSTFGIVMSNVVAAPLVTLLIHRKKLARRHSTAPEADIPARPRIVSILDELRALAITTKPFWLTLLLLLACAKASAYVTWLIAFTGISFPVQVGAMIVGLAVRFLADRSKLPLIHVPHIEAIGAVTLALFLSMAMMTLDLARLSAVALPMVVLLVIQVALISLYALSANFRMMGKDYEAAVTSAGLLGFGLGATPNAIASMKSLVNAYGPAPRAFLVVPVTGAFLSDVLNVLVITAFFNALGFFAG